MPFTNSSGSGTSRRWHDVGANTWVSPQRLRALQDASSNAAGVRGSQSGPPQTARSSVQSDNCRTPVMSVSAVHADARFISPAAAHRDMETLLRHIISSAMLPSDWGIYICNSPSGGTAIVIGGGLRNEVNISVNGGNVIVRSQRHDGATGYFSDLLGHGYFELLTRHC